MLALPVLLLCVLARRGPTAGAGALSGVSLVAGGGGALAAAGFLGWFASLVRGRMPHGLRDLGTYALGYGAQATGYMLLLTDRYPNCDPAVIEPTQALPRHPVRIEVTDPLRRSRLTVFFRLLLAMPHFVWLTLWTRSPSSQRSSAGLIASVTGRLPGSPPPLPRRLHPLYRSRLHLLL